MSKKRKICVITGTRAEYGLLYFLLKGIQNTGGLELQIIATGMHLSPEFGLTYKQIEQDSFTINRRVEMLLSSDTESGISKSMGIGMLGFADAFCELQPDLVVVLGDRFEIFSAVSAATVAKIPVAHLHGGETTEGAFDESFRHSITKMSHLHFTATERYRRRVIQLGESPDRVFNFGAVGVDNIKQISLLSREEFEASIDFKLAKYNLLVTFHPVTLESLTSENQLRNVLSALDKLKDTHLIFTKANSDTDGRIINNVLDQYVKENPDKSAVYTSLGQVRYLSAMQYVDAVVGNSSSGLIEAPSFRIGTVNIGDRQLGRIKASSVIDCSPTAESIFSAINKLYSEEFQENLKMVKNPYGEGKVVDNIIQVLRKQNLNGILKKKFHDIDI